MNAQNVLSVVMPVYNERKTILKIIGKVLRLDFVKEVIVVDDGRRQIEGTAPGGRIDSDDFSVEPELTVAHV